MSNNFEWQTEDVEQWPEVTAVAAESEQLPSRRLVALVIVFLVAIGGWVVYQQVEQRVEATRAATEMDVLSAHSLVRQAAQQQDVELLATVLSGRDRRWTAVQKTLVQDGLLLDRSSFGFQVQPGAALPLATADNITVTLSPDLTEAEATWLEPFVVSASGEVTETVSLRQTGIFRQGARSWLLSPPERAFWGQWQQARGAYVAMVYPERDERVARRLVHDLDAIIVRACTHLEGITCPAGLGLRLRLETDAGSLLAVNDAETTLMSGRSLTLPTPTLVGLPVDEAGYQALVRGYGAHVVSALITDIVGYECCIHGLFYHALLDRQLSQMGLRPWPLTETDYEQLLSNSGARPGMGLLWAAGTSLDLPAAWDRMRIYSLADFLLTEVQPDTAVAEVQRTLGRRVVFAVWFTRLTGARYDAGAFNGAWLEFIYQRSTSGRTDLPVPLPEQELGLVCSERNQGVWLYHYDWDSGNWRQEFGREYVPGPVSGYVYPLPGESAYVLQEAFFPTAQGEVRLSVWQDGHEIFVLDQSPGVTSSTYPFYFDGSDPTGRYLVLRTLGQRRDSRYQILDLTSCGNGGCERYSLPGRPLWTPDGAQTLLLGESPVTSAAAGAEPDPWLAPLFRGDARGQSVISLGAGLEPFWLDRETYGYLRQTGDDVELVTAVAGDDSPHVVLRGADLLPLIAPTGRPDVMIDTVLANPADARQAVVMARTVGAEAGDGFTFFLLQLTADRRAVAELTRVFQTEQPAPIGGFSPDGRWLVISTWNADARNYTVHLIELQSNERQAFNGSGSTLLWSADSEWLVQPEGEYLLLRAPAYGYQRLLRHDFSACYSAHWFHGRD